MTRRMRLDSGGAPTSCRPREDVGTARSTDRRNRFVPRMPELPSRRGNGPGAVRRAETRRRSDAVPEGHRRPPSARQHHSSPAAREGQQAPPRYQRRSRASPVPSGADGCHDRLQRHTACAHRCTPENVGYWRPLGDSDELVEHVVR